MVEAMAAGKPTRSRGYHRSSSRWSDSDWSPICSIRSIPRMPLVPWRLWSGSSAATAPETMRQANARAMAAPYLGRRRRRLPAAVRRHAQVTAVRIETEPDVVQTDDSQFVEIGPLHAAALSRLFSRNAGIDTTRVFDPFPLTVETARTIAERPDKDRYFAAELDGELLGITMLRGWEEGYETPSFGILVDREHHGQRSSAGE